ncbi:MAG: CHASE2 domain-containing protein [Spirochaetota bacterium]
MKNGEVRSILKRVLLNDRRSWILAGLTAFAAAAAFSFTAIYDRFELSLYDIRFKIKPDVEQWDALVLLDIDDSSIINVGEFPWPRNHYSRGVKVLKDQGVQNFLFDIQFMDKSPRFADRAKMDELRSRILKRRKIFPEDIDAAVVDNDAVLASAVRSFPGNILP